MSLLPKMRQFGIDMNFSPEEFQRFRQEMRTIWIEPAMHRLAEEIKFLKPMTCMKLPIPSGCDTNCARITNKAHGFDLRFIRAWDIGSIEYEDIDENGKAYVIPASPPRWINRFDIAVA